MEMRAAIEVEDLSKVYQVHKKEPGLAASLRGLFVRRSIAVPAVTEVSFRIDRGELVGFLGPNGAGKTTTIKMLAGILHPTAGSVQVIGHQPWRREHAFQRRISLVMGQKNQLWWDLPALESFILNREIYGVPEREFQESLDELVDLLDLGDLLRVPVRKLSLGERMKCELAGALLHRPEVLFLDEPTIGLDVVMQQKMREFIKEYNRRHRATILLTSHYMADVTELCERVLIVNQGRLVYDGPLAEIVRRYANHRILSVAFDRPVPLRDLAAIGEVVSGEDLRAVIRVPRERVSSQAAALLAGFPVADLAIQEVDVDDIIRQVFAE
ncbi:MAG TPA: ATP-binding cassette domain-containing protein [Dehalococcoidia bacterium]|nr:ATP-binding cassette domain-containing protein [Dehalococcoidia bacterium]